MTIEEILDAMATYGGSFVQQLAKLYRLGDDTNRQLLEQTFEHYFVEYAELAARAASQTRPQ